MSSSRPTLVLVSGSGRSGTSSLAGSLKRLGLHVPQPEVVPKPANPRGFYEPRWVIRFHGAYLKQLGMHNIDSRPSAVDLVQDLVASGEPLTRLLGWLEGQLDQPQIVVKDPHAFWFADVWAEACRTLGVDLRWLTALRHPAEVVGSRDLAYRQHRSDAVRLAKETSNVAGWVHAALLTEKAGRSGPRAFIRYTDLIEDWRAALAPVAGELELDFNTDLATKDQHPVDDFLEASMRRSQVTWADISVPARLQDMAEEVWQLLGGMVTSPRDEAAMRRLDEIHEEYRQMYAEAAALTLDQRAAETTLAVRQAKRKKQEVIHRLRQRIRRKNQTLEQLRTRVQVASAPPTASWLTRSRGVIRRVWARR